MEHNLGMVVGSVCGFFVGLALVWVLVKIVKKFGGKVDFLCKKDSFDERQLLARGKAYRAAFFTLVGYVVVLALIAEMSKNFILLSIGGLWLGIMISLLVFAITCILKDAYMSLYENAKGVLILFVIVALLNFGLTAGNIAHGMKLIEDNQLSGSSINLMIGIIFIIIAAVFAGKLLYDKKQEQEDEE